MRSSRILVTALLLAGCSAETPPDDPSCLDGKCDDSRTGSLSHIREGSYRALGMIAVANVATAAELRDGAGMWGDSAQVLVDHREAHGAFATLADLEDTGIGGADLERLGPYADRRGLTPSCGDGALQPVEEECDDGNGAPGDRCSAGCLHTPIAGAIAHDWKDAGYPYLFEELSIADGRYRARWKDGRPVYVREEAGHITVEARAAGDFVTFLPDDGRAGRTWRFDVKRFDPDHVTLRFYREGDSWPDETFVRPAVPEEPRPSPEADKLSWLRGLEPVERTWGYGEILAVAAGEGGVYAGVRLFDDAFLGFERIVVKDPPLDVIVKFDGAGKLLWWRPSPRLVALAVDGDGALYAASDSGVQKLTAAGDPVWGAQVSGRFTATINGMAVAGGRVYVAGIFQDTLHLGDVELVENDPRDPYESAYVGWLSATTGAGGAAVLSTVDPFTVAASERAVVVGGEAKGGIAWRPRAEELDPDLRLRRTWDFQATGPEASEPGGRVRAAAFDGAGNVLLAGHLDGSVDLGAGPAYLHSNQGFVARYGAAGLAWSRVWGADWQGDDAVTGLAVGRDGAIWATGRFEGLLDVGLGPVDGFAGSFVAKLAGDGSPRWFQTVRGGHGERGTLALGPGGEAYLGTAWSGTPPGLGVGRFAP